MNEGDTVERRVQAIMALMRSNAFVAGETVRGLAAEWGITVDQSRRYTAEASRRIRAEAKELLEHDGAHELVLLRTIRFLTHVVDMAKEEPRRWGDGIKAAQTLTNITGAGAPTKIDVTGELRTLSEEELRQRIAAALDRAKRTLEEQPSEAALAGAAEEHRDTD